MMNKNGMDDLFEELLRKSAALAAKELGEEAMEGEECELSEEHKKKMKKLFDSEKRKIRMNKFVRYASRTVAVLAAVTIVSFGIKGFDAGALRVRLMNMFTSTEPTNTEISFNDGTSYSNGYITVGYVPDGFELDIEKVLESFSSLRFKRDKEYFTITVRNIDRGVSVDTENTIDERMNINGIEVFYSKKSKDNIFTYNINECTVNVMGNIEKEILIQIIEDIKIN
ncbi:MAG: DUF4367 domain-containing protein [Clostridia bacterium]|nr:DUF4367 domain-containing protein [Clostridia bacterium]